MNVISNFVDIPKEENRIRWSIQEDNFITEKYPSLIKFYTKYMKRVDKSNQLINYYEASRETKKWWKKIFFHFIEYN